MISETHLNTYSCFVKEGVGHGAGERCAQSNTDGGKSAISALYKRKCKVWSVNQTVALGGLFVYSLRPVF